MPKGKVRRANGMVVGLDMVWFVKDQLSGSFTVLARWKECQYSSVPLTREEADSLRDALMVGGLFDEQLKPLDGQ
jgi:hypothetical protein